MPPIGPDPPLQPPATIGVLGGGQLGRMVGVAARALSYGFVVLDPDPDCPAAAVADRVVCARYDDLDGALRMAAATDVITYELEHVAVDVVRRLEGDRPVRPGVYALSVTQDRLLERRFLESEGAAVAPWREVRTVDDVRHAADELGLPIRIKAVTGGYDGRGQVRLTSVDLTSVESRLERIGRPPGEPLLAEREVDFEAELSVVCTRGIDGRTTVYPVSRNRHEEGILIETVAPAPVPPEVVDAAVALVRRLAEGLDLVGTLTAELFLLADGALAVNELAPRVHNTGHWTIEGAVTSQFSQHVRAICGLPLGDVTPIGTAAMVNLLGTGERRPASPTGLQEALADPGVAVHIYGKREVFERRKMGHVTVVEPAGDPEAVLKRARSAGAKISWAAS